jgi:hypothetical protein
MKQYVLTAQILGRLKYRESKRTELVQGAFKNPLLQCMSCRTDVVVGDVLVGTKGTNHSKRYHLECARKLNIIS